jgi:hypothetical protein
MHFFAVSALVNYIGNEGMFPAKGAFIGIKIGMQ